MMRRLFFRNTAIGAAAAPLLISGVRVMPDDPRPIPPDYLVKGVESRLTQVMRDPLQVIKDLKRIDYNKSMNELDRIQHNIRYKHSHIQNLSLNIESLKSVSKQHKANMQLELLMRMNEEKRSWKDKLLAQFGLSRDDVYDDEPQAASNGY